MTTYEISDGINNIFDIVKNNLTKLDGPDENFLKELADGGDKTRLNPILSQIHVYMRTITEAKKKEIGGDTDIINNNTTNDEIKKIHFLAAAIYRHLVLKVLEELEKRPNTYWSDVKTVIDTNLKLDANGVSSTKFGHFYINPVNITKLSIANADNILMYQLLQQLIANNLNPDIDDVLNFLSKIDKTWGKKIDEGIVQRVIDESKNQNPPTQVFTYFKDNEPVSTLARLYDVDPSDPLIILSVNYKKTAEFIDHINDVISNAIKYNAQMTAFFNNTNYTNDIAAFTTAFNNGGNTNASNGESMSAPQLAAYIITNPYEKANKNDFTILKFLQEVKNLKVIIDKIVELKKPDAKEINELFTDSTFKFNEFITQFQLIKGQYETNLLKDTYDKILIQADQVKGGANTAYQNTRIKKEDLDGLLAKIVALQVRV